MKWFFCCSKQLLSQAFMSNCCDKIFSVRRLFIKMKGIERSRRNKISSNINKFYMQPSESLSYRWSLQKSMFDGVRNLLFHKRKQKEKNRKKENIFHKNNARFYSIMNLWDEISKRAKKAKTIYERKIHQDSDSNCRKKTYVWLTQKNKILFYSIIQQKYILKSTNFHFTMNKLCYLYYYNRN